MEMQENRSASSAVAITLSSSSSSSSQLQKGARQKYERNLQGMKKIAFVTDLITICNWFLGFCALTWASAVLLGAYIEKLGMWDYYDVSLLLFVEGLRFGLAALLRSLGYRLSDLIRWSLQSVAFFLPLGMGGFAVLSILPSRIRLSIHHRFSSVHYGSRHYHRVLPVISHTLDPAPPPSDSSYESLSPSLTIFYVLVLANAFVLLLGTSITGIMRRRYVRSSVKSLCQYYDRMMYSTTSWLHPAVDLGFAFQIQGSQYREGQNATDVCESYADLICYLYMHEKGVVAAEAALAAEDGYVREAAANIMGFWAVLETLEEVQGVKRLPLCFQKGMLSMLVDIAAESYGSLGTAAARSFSLLLEFVDLELIGMVACMRSKSNTKQDLIDILLRRTAELLHPPCPTTYMLPPSLKEECQAHVYALRQYLLRLQSTCEGMSGAMSAFIEVQRAQLVQKLEKALPQMVKESNLSTIRSLDSQLSILLPPVAPAERNTYYYDIKTYYYDIKSKLTAPSPPPSPIKASFLLLFNVAVPLVCLGVGFILNALL